MISGYDSSLYNERLSTWWTTTFPAKTRGRVAMEKMWLNFDPEKQVKHDYQYTGPDYHKRQDIKRKGERWIKNLRGMSANERNYILRLIMSEFLDEIEEGHIG